MDAREAITMTPWAWCQYVRGLARERQPASGEVPYLDLLLTYVIDCDLSREDFQSLLSRCAAEPAGGLAEAARGLQTAWQRAQVEPPPPPRMLPLRETLRTVGGLLDGAGCKIASMTLSHGSMRVETFGDVGPDGLGLPERTLLAHADLRQYSAAYMALRGQGATTTPSDRIRYETALRLVGEALEGLPEQEFELIVTPQLVTVQGSSGYAHTFNLDNLLAPSAARVEPPPAPTG